MGLENIISNGTVLTKLLSTSMFVLHPTVIGKFFKYLQFIAVFCIRKEKQSQKQLTKMKMHLRQNMMQEVNHLKKHFEDLDMLKKNH